MPFLSFESEIVSKTVKDTDAHIYADYRLILGENKSISNRSVYSLLSFLGDIGGFQQSFFTLGFLANLILLARYPAATILEKGFRIVASKHDEEGGMRGPPKAL